jgi:histidinol-phosphate aminotransferase
VYASAVPLATTLPGVIVSRTFSKAHGIAGLRLGYVVGRPETLGRLTPLLLPLHGNVFAIAAAMATLDDRVHIERERRRNDEVRRFTLDFFTRAGFPPTASQTNFVFVNVGRPAATFRAACAAERVLVGRDFPPMAATHSRISLGTMDEMRRATAAFARVLAQTPSGAGGGA